MTPKKVLFITGTRADYGKMKSLIKILQDNPLTEVYIFVCGMHLSETFGSTYLEVLNDHYDNVYVAYGINQSQNTSQTLSSTIACLSGYVENIKPDLIIVHGDRMDAMAGALVGALNNIIVGHIEGGELSGTIDESIRHAITKFAHIHFVCTQEAKRRLIQLGEEENRIFVIGSPDIDVMLSDRLPSLEAAKERYEIPFDRYGILMYHPVTTEFDTVGEKIHTVVDAVIESGRNFVVIYPNNDLGSSVILNEYKRFKGCPRIKIFPSLRFEYFLTLLRYADCIVGNSSAGIRESCVYGIPGIDIGTRQSGRYSTSTIGNLQHVNEEKDAILQALAQIEDFRRSSSTFGDGNSTLRFNDILSEPSFWDIQIQKHFIDYDI